MIDENAPARKHLTSAREHLAGVKAAVRWYQELAAEHLLASQTPIKDRPATPVKGEKRG